MKDHTEDPVYEKILDAHEKFRNEKMSARDLVRELKQMSYQNKRL